MNIEAESNKRFFKQLIEERVLNLKYGGQSRRNHFIVLTFLTDGDEYLYPIRGDISTIDRDTLTYVRALATKAGIDVRVESINSSVAEDSSTRFGIGEDDLGKLDKKPAQTQHRALLALSGVIVSKIFRGFALKCFPGLNRHRGYWPLFCYLLFGSWHDERTRGLLLCAEILSEIEGRDP